MPHDNLPKPDSLELENKVDEWDGPWGSIASVAHSVETLCVRIEEVIGKPCIYYYPYRTIGKWKWNMADPETLEIHAGGNVLAISGSGLRRLSEALNDGQLRFIKLEREYVESPLTCVRSILIQDPATITT